MIENNKCTCADCNCQNCNCTCSQNSAMENNVNAWMSHFEPETSKVGFAGC